ncbi:nitroreductase family protein [Nesterenkonia ebinurensis]|uniref:nitroreductase family protein n=1 Tax=Nesterenkonia ebinurensis TaxID=2608252 RepID=UPI00168AC82B|nr:nitroreductase family protein [Nesterenkonia ebinurensis]
MTKTRLITLDGLSPGTYRYLPAEHSLAVFEQGDHHAGLTVGTLDAAWLKGCPLILILSADLTAADRAFEVQETGRGERFCWFEAGLVSQNIYLWAAENGFGTVFLGGLDYAKTRSATERWMPASHTVLGMLPFGYPAGLSASSPVNRQWTAGVPSLVILVGLMTHPVEFHKLRIRGRLR